MSHNHDTSANVVSKLRSVQEPIQAMRHYLNSIPDDDVHYNLFNILISKLEFEYESLEEAALKSLL